jgi:hypothetical protein
VNEEAFFEERDPFGLTSDDWMSYLGFSPDGYTGPAMLFWALAGDSRERGEYPMNGRGLPALLSSVAGDARALATLAFSSREEDVRALGSALDNLYRRIATATEIAIRMANEEEDARVPHAGPPDELALRSPKLATHRRG